MEGSKSDATPSRRRRSRGFVTQNACVECRKRRSKCDGRNPCCRCAAQNRTQCVYEIPTRLSKEAMRQEIDQLQQRLQLRESILSALISEQSSDVVLQQLKSRVPLEEILSQLEKTMPSLRSSQGMPSWGMSSDPDRGSFEQEQSEEWRIQAPGFAYGMEARLNLGQSYQADIMEDETEPPYPGFISQWTSVTQDTDLVRHLFTLYFCWEYPLFLTLSKEHFLSDFQTGRSNYCSALLVNALLALGSRISDQRESAEDVNKNSTSGDQFFAEAEKLLTEQDGPSLPTVQALGLMAIYEARCGRDSESWFYSRQSIYMAVEMGLHAESYDEDDLPARTQEVRATTFWGAFTLDHAWSLALGHLPHVSRGINRVEKPAVVENLEASTWIQYTDNGKDPDNNFQPPSNLRSIYRCFCELSEIVHYSLYSLFSPSMDLNSNSVLDIYTQYLAWYSSLPESMHLTEDSTPAVLFVHQSTYYHFAMTMLLRPFIKLRFLNSDIIPYDICLRAANNISSVVENYKQMYGVRYTPAFFPYIILASSISQLVLPPPAVMNIGRRSQITGITYLQELSTHHPFAHRAIRILQYFIRQSGLDLDVTRSTNLNDDPSALLLLDPGSMTFFCPSTEASSAVIKKSNDVLFFRPFPMQGVPLLGEGCAGFELLE